MNQNGWSADPRLEADHQPEGTEESYSVQVAGKYGLQIISVLARSEQEAVRKLAEIAGKNRVHPETFGKNGSRFPGNRWQRRL